MCEDIMQMASGTRRPPIAGILKGYSRRAVKGEHFPALLPDPDSTVEGIIYRNISVAAWGRLDRYENMMYQRNTVQVELDNGVVISAEAYLTRPEYSHLLDESAWDFQYFLRKTKSRFLHNCQGYRTV